MAYPFFSVGLHNPHSHPRTLSSLVTIAKVALLFIAVSPTAGLHTLYYCQSMTLHIRLCAFPMHLLCISEALLHTLMHCVSDSACYTTPHHPLHLCLCTCCLCLFVCLFTFVTGACVACFVCLFTFVTGTHVACFVN